ncbi:MAG: sugar phosphate isomerase/epimerase [Thermoproteales archaeon]|nr:sugar phosphate isomerase/epimerase [Thermoproteales archaeon]
MDIGHLIGISTHFIPMTYNETLEEIIDKIVKAGITAFELVTVEYQAQIGWPYNIPNVGLWFRDMNNQEIQKLKDNLSVFDIVTIHGQHLELNIASSNKGIREESYRQYLECLELARKLDVETVTYHTGHQTRGFIRDIQEIIKYNVYYGKKLANHAREHGIRIGYETGSISMLDKIFSHFKPDELGVNIDLGHTAMQRINPETVIEKWKDRIVEIHFNGVNHYWG